MAINWPYGVWPATYDPQRFPENDNVIEKRFSVETAHDIGQYDLIFSHYVGKHVEDINAFANLSKNCLAEIGNALHVIDFGGHEWERFDDPFLFLKFPDSIWKWMGSARGLPNRIRFGEYKQAFEDAGLVVQVPYIKKLNMILKMYG